MNFRWAQIIFVSLIFISCTPNRNVEQDKFCCHSLTGTFCLKPRVGFVSHINSQIDYTDYWVQFAGQEYRYNLTEGSEFVFPYEHELVRQLSETLWLKKIADADGEYIFELKDGKAPSQLLVNFFPIPNSENEALDKLLNGVIIRDGPAFSELSICSNK